MKPRSLLSGPLPVLIALLALWALVVRVFRLPAYILPGPLAVARASVAHWHTLLTAFKITGLEAGGGFALSLVAGIVLGFVFSLSRWMRRSLYPYSLVLQTVPIVAIAPLILMWFGSGLQSVMLVAFIICIFPVVANTTQGLVSVDPNHMNLFKMSDASALRVLIKLRLPSALPHIFTGLRIASGIAVVGAITGELFASSNTVGQGGLGYSITYASSQMQTDYLFALVIASSALGFLFYFSVVWVEWLCLHRWHDSIVTPE
jgi:NitT/TauT family transport system permease protein